MVGAILGGAAIGGLANIFGAKMGADAMGDAASKQQASTAAALAQQAKYQDPYHEAGKFGLGAQMAMLGGAAPEAPDIMQMLASGQFGGGAAGNVSQEMINAFQGKNPEEIYAELVRRAEAGDPHMVALRNQYKTQMDDYTQKAQIYEQFSGQKAPGFSPSDLPSFGYSGEQPEWQRGSSWEGYDPNQLTEDPGYQFRLSEGLGAIEGSAAARGLLQSGKTLKDIGRFSQDLASQEFGAARGRALQDQQLQAQEQMQDFQIASQQEGQDYQRQLGQYGADYGRAQDIYNIQNQRYSDQFNRLANLSGQGQVAAQQMGANAMTGASMANQAIGQAGAAQANMYGQMGQSVAGVAETAGMMPFMQQMMQDRNPSASSTLYTQPTSTGGGGISVGGAPTGQSLYSMMQNG